MIHTFPKINLKQHAPSVTQATVKLIFWGTYPCTNHRLLVVSVYIRPDHLSCANKIVKNQSFVQKYRKIHQTIEN